MTSAAEPVLPDVAATARVLVIALDIQRLRGKPASNALLIFLRQIVAETPESSA